MKTQQETIQQNDLQDTSQRLAYNPDEEGLYQDMISAAVEMKILFWSNFLETIDGYNDDLDWFLAPLINELYENCGSFFQEYWKTQDKESEVWHHLSLSERVAQFVEEESHSVINCAIHDRELSLKVLEHLNILNLNTEITMEVADRMI